MRLLIGLLKQILTWDSASKIALLVDLVLLALALLVLMTVSELRTPALIGTAGLLIALQGIVLWGNRNMVTPYTQARRYFVAGEFARARDVLREEMDSLQANGKALSVDALVLLGNTYRNLGQPRESESVLRIAIARQPDSHFAQYGLAKTRQATGDYNSAIAHLTEALKLGAPAIIRFDLAFTQYLRDDNAAARAVLNSIPETDEIYRVLMTAYLHHELTQSSFPEQALIEAGLPFWEAEIERYGHMPYGRDLQVIVRRLRELSST